MTRVVSWFSCGAASAVATKLAIYDFGYFGVLPVYCETGAISLAGPMLNFDFGCLDEQGGLIDQTILALYKANPDAFASGSINQLAAE